MFTLFIHTLEVLAMNPNSFTTVDKIVEMGCEYDHKQVVSALRSLEKEGYVTSIGKGRSKEWQITEKAIEHCEHVTRAYSKSDWTRAETPQEVKPVPTAEYLRGMLVNRAKRLMLKNKVSAHVALEETQSAWRQNRVHTEAVNYYVNCSEAELESLITEVVKAASKDIVIPTMLERFEELFPNSSNGGMKIWARGNTCGHCGSDVEPGYTLCSDCLGAF